MAKMQKITPDTLDAFRDEFTNLLKKYGNEKGLTFKMGGISYSSGTFSYKLTANLEGAVPREAEVYDKKARFLGLPPRGTVVISENSGKKFKLTGFNTRASKNKILMLEISTGETYHCSIHHLKNQLKVRKE